MTNDSCNFLGFQDRGDSHFIIGSHIKNDSRSPRSYVYSHNSLGHGAWAAHIL
jgi:hypothetical protein